MCTTVPVAKAAMRRASEQLYTRKRGSQRMVEGSPRIDESHCGAPHMPMPSHPSKNTNVSSFPLSHGLWRVNLTNILAGLLRRVLLLLPGQPNAIFPH